MVPDDDDPVTPVVPSDAADSAAATVIQHGHPAIPNAVALEGPKACIKPASDCSSGWRVLDSPCPAMVKLSNEDLTSRIGCGAKVSYKREADMVHER